MEDVGGSENVENISVSCSAASLKLDIRKYDAKQMIYKELMKIVDEDEIRGIVFYPKDWARKCILTFKTKQMKNKVLIEGLTLFDRAVDFNDEDDSIVKLKIEDTPNEMSDDTLKRILGKYGTVIDVEKSMLVVDEKETNCYDGIRYAYISGMHEPIPQKISGQIKGQTVSLFITYKNQPRNNKSVNNTAQKEMKCYRCGDSKHRVDSCPLQNKVCFMCQSDEHTQKDCPKNDGSKRDENTVVFLSASCPLSNWYKEDFEVDSREFSCMEQYLTFCKASMFNDHEAKDEVMKESHQRIMKVIGEQVKNYNHREWLDELDTTINTGLRAKFLVGEARKFILNTESRIIGEASENRRWGTGVHFNSPHTLDHSKWTGTNFMGQMLMSIREEICEIDKKEKEEIVMGEAENEDNQGGKSDSNISTAAIASGGEDIQHYSALIGDVNINLKINVELPCEVKVKPIPNLKIDEIETRIAEAEFDPDKTAILIVHAGSHEWSSSRTDTAVTSGEAVFNHFKTVIENIGDKFTHTELIISSIPLRKPKGSNGQRITEINLQIQKLNELLENHCTQQGYLTFLDNSLQLSPGNEVNRSLYHNSMELNKNGKAVILENICKAIPVALTRWGTSNKMSDLFDESD